MRGIAEQGYTAARHFRRAVHWRPIAKAPATPGRRCSNAILQRTARLPDSPTSLIYEDYVVPGL